MFCRAGNLLANARLSSADRSCSAWSRSIWERSAGPLACSENLGRVAVAQEAVTRGLLSTGPRRIAMLHISVAIQGDMF